MSGGKSVKVYVNLAGHCVIWVVQCLCFPMLSGQLLLTKSSLASEAKFKVHPVKAQTLKSRAGPQLAQELHLSTSERYAPNNLA